MKVQTIITATALATTMALAAVAPTWAAGMAVLDAQSIITNANAAKRAVTSLTQQREAAQAKINALEAPLVEKQKKLIEQRSVMAPDKLAAAEESLKKDVIAFRTQAQAIQEGLEREGFKARQTISDAVRQVVAEIAKEKGYDVVLPKGLVLFSAASIPDITADTLARTNAKLDK